MQSRMMRDRNGTENVPLKEEIEAEMKALEKEIAELLEEL